MPSESGRHVEQQHVLDVALQHARLNGRADRDHLVGIDALVRLLAKELFDDFLDLGHARHAADQDHLVDLGRRQASVLQRLAAGLDRALDEVVDQSLELGPGQLQRQMLRPGRVGGDVGQVDFGLRRRGELDLRFLRRLLQALEGELVLGEINALLLLEFARQIFDQPHVEVLAAEERVAVGRLHFEHAVADLEDRDIERAAAEVIDRDGAGFLLVEAIGERRRRRLVDDAQHLEPGDLAGVLGRLTLGVVEISGNGDDGLGHRTAEIGFGRLLHLLQDEGGNLRGRVLLAVSGDPGVAVGSADDLVGDEAHVLLGHRIVERPSDEALDGEEGALRIGHRLAFCGLADQPLAIVGKGHDRGRRARAFRILDHLGGRALHDSDARIGGAEVDANYFRHFFFPLFTRETARPQKQPSLMRSIPPCAPSHRPSSSGLRSFNARFPPVRRVSRPNRPVGPYIGGAIWPRKARKRRILQALGALRRAARAFPFFLNASRLEG